MSQLNLKNGHWYLSRTSTVSNRASRSGKGRTLMPRGHLLMGTKWVCASLLLISNILGCAQDADVLDEHYVKNQRPWPPNASNLATVGHHDNGSANVDNNESDSSIKLHNKCYSKTLKNTHTASPTQIGFYPPKWKDFLEQCKVEMRAYAVISDPWPHRRQMLNGFILNTINIMILRWKRDEKSSWKGLLSKVQEGYGGACTYCQMSKHWLLTIHSSWMIWLCGMVKSRKSGWQCSLCTLQPFPSQGQQPFEGPNPQTCETSHFWTHQEVYICTWQ